MAKLQIRRSHAPAIICHFIKVGSLAKSLTGISQVYEVLEWGLKHYFAYVLMQLLYNMHNCKLVLPYSFSYDPS